MSDSIKIACPKCGWEPDGGSHWSCTCGTKWNTFETAGRCPSCSRHWEYTQCTEAFLGGCRQWSLHEDWYRGLDEWVAAEIEDLEFVLNT